MRIFWLTFKRARFGVIWTGGMVHSKKNEINFMINFYIIITALIIINYQLENSNAIISCVNNY